jgi:hypothetical protein
LKSDFNTSVDFNNYNLNYKDPRRKLIDINLKVNNSDFDIFKTEQLNKLLEIITDYYTAKAGETKLKKTMTKLGTTNTPNPNDKKNKKEKSNKN